MQTRCYTVVACYSQAHRIKQINKNNSKGFANIGTQGCPMVHMHMKQHFVVATQCAPAVCMYIPSAFVFVMISFECLMIPT